jgi:hypothetical protein
MICNGDIATQLDAGPTDGSVKALESYKDDQERMRLRLVGRRAGAAWRRRDALR